MRIVADSARARSLNHPAQRVVGQFSTYSNRLLKGVSSSTNTRIIEAVLRADRRNIAHQDVATALVILTQPLTFGHNLLLRDRHKLMLVVY